MKTFSSKEVAQIFQCNESTVRRWTYKGMLQCHKTPGGHRHFSLYDLRQFISKHQPRYKDKILSLSSNNANSIDNFISSSDYSKLAKYLMEMSLEGNDSEINYMQIPQGRLREPWENLKRADAIFITKDIPKQFLLKKLNDSNIKYYNTKTHSSLVQEDSLKKASNIKREEKNVFLLSGIADPNNFKKTVTNLNFKIVGYKSFPDHFHFNQKTIDRTISNAKISNADYIITTEKDWVKINPLTIKFPFLIVKIKLEIIEKNIIKKIVKQIK